MSTTIPRPASTEYAPHYGTYVTKVPDGDVLHLLSTQVGDTVQLLSGLSERDAAYRYAEGKWSTKEVVGHLSDVERVMVYRAMRFARGDETPLPAFDENQYVAGANFDSRPLGELVEELRAVRRASIVFFSSLDDAALARSGTASNNRITVRALAYVVAGHERHHVALFNERYLPGLRAAR